NARDRDSISREHVSGVAAAGDGVESQRIEDRATGHGAAERIDARGGSQETAEIALIVVRDGHCFVGRAKGPRTLGVVLIGGVKEGLIAAVVDLWDIDGRSETEGVIVLAIGGARSSTSLVGK